MSNSLFEALEKFDPDRSHYAFARERHWAYHSGATKGCFILPNRKYVLKFTIDNEETSFDETAREAQIYQEAVVRGIERIFLPTKQFYTNHFGVTFYTQPRITQESCCVRYDEGIALLGKSIHLKGNMDVELIGRSMKVRPNDETWTLRAYHVYGKKFMQEFAAFTQDWGINDLHKGNTGYLKNRPVLLDYSGYHRNSYSPTSSDSEEY